MSTNLIGGINYALVKRHYDLNDYTAFRPPVALVQPFWFNGLPFTATQDYYVVGFLAALHDINVVDVTRGWTLFTHGQPAAPAYLAPFLPALGITTWPAALPSFEAKDILFYADQNCWVRFVGSLNVQHYIPQNTYKRYHQRCFMFFVQRDTADGTLQCWIEG